MFVVLTLLLVSVNTTFVYDTFARTSVCPDGQENEPALGASKVMLPVTFPFWGVKLAPPVRFDETVSLFAALGWFPPPLRQAYVAVPVALSV
jgi:hypothetical protein